MPLGYIPAGSTNVFARNHRIPARPASAAENIVHGVVHPLDLGRFNGRSFAYVAACGAFSWLSYSTSQNMKNVLGPSAYVLDAIRELQKIRPFHLRVETETAALEGDYLFAAVSNVSNIASAMNLPSDEVIPDDGLFELVLIREPNAPGEWPPLVSSVTSGNITSPYMTFLHSARMRIYCDTDLVWVLDGERADPSGIIDIINEPKRLLLRT